MAKPKPRAGAQRPHTDDTERDENAPEPTAVITMVRDKPVQPGGPTSVEVPVDEEEKYTAGGWRRATAKEAKEAAATTGEGE